MGSEGNQEGIDNQAVPCVVCHLAAFVGPQHCFLSIAQTRECSLKMRTETGFSLEDIIGWVYLEEINRLQVSTRQLRRKTSL